MTSIRPLSQQGQRVTVDGEETARFPGEVVLLKGVSRLARPDSHDRRLGDGHDEPAAPAEFHGSAGISSRPRYPIAGSPGKSPKR